MKGTQFYQQKRSIPYFWIIVVVATAVLAGAGLRMNNVLPAGVPLVGMDSGVALCKAIAEQGSVGDAPVAQTDLAEIQRVRALFADSRYDDLRMNGVTMMDLSAQFVTMGAESGDLGTALALVGPMMTANAGLAGGCREHGFEIPMMGAKP